MTGQALEYLHSASGSGPLIVLQPRLPVPSPPRSTAFDVIQPAAAQHVGGHVVEVREPLDAWSPGSSSARTSTPSTSCLLRTKPLGSNVNIGSSFDAGPSERVRPDRRVVADDALVSAGASVDVRLPGVDHRRNHGGDILRGLPVWKLA